MLGRTHVAIGTCAAAAMAPFMYHVPHMITVLQDISRFSLPTSVTKEVIAITAAAFGSYLPDLDQQDSTAARRVERVGQVVALIALVLLLVVMKLTASPIAWLCTASIAFAVLTRRNVARKVALGVIVAAVFYFGVTNHASPAGTMLLAAWGIGAMFTKHRTFTHSCVGTLIFLVGVHDVVGTFFGGVLFVGIALGYILHICADLIADGTALLWPFPHRLGLPLVKTGGPLDHLVGALATLLFIFSVVRAG